MNIILDDKCPYCKSYKLKKDFNRAEVYCEDCGTVLSMPYDYVGGVKVQNIWSYHYSRVNSHIEHTAWRNKKNYVNNVKPSKIINFYHNIPDNKIFYRRY